MKLYEIRFRHYAPKDSEEGIKCYYCTDTDEDVYEWLKSEPELKPEEEGIYLNWKYKDNPDNEDEFEEGFKERIIKCCGDMYDEESEVYDLYYGATQYGWQLVNEDFTYDEYLKLKNMGVKCYSIDDL